MLLDAAGDAVLRIRAGLVEPPQQRKAGAATGASESCATETGLELVNCWQALCQLGC